MSREKEAGQSKSEYLLMLGGIGLITAVIAAWAYPGLQQQTEIAKNSKYGMGFDDHNGHIVDCYTNARPLITEVVISQQVNVTPQEREARVQATDVWCFNYHAVLNDKLAMGFPVDNPIPQMNVIEKSVTLFQQPQPEASAPT